MKSPILVVPALVFLLFATTAHAETPPPFHVAHAMQPPKIDGDLHDEIWNDARLETDEWISYNPLYGTKMPQKTNVYIAYDERNLYFAFHCLDSEPAKIRTTLSKRDNAFND